MIRLFSVIRPSRLPSTYAELKPFDTQVPSKIIARESIPRAARRFTTPPETLLYAYAKKESRARHDLLLNQRDDICE